MLVYQNFPFLTFSWGEGGQMPAFTGFFSLSVWRSRAQHFASPKEQEPLVLGLCLLIFYLNFLVKLNSQHLLSCPVCFWLLGLNTLALLPKKGGSCAILISGVDPSDLCSQYTSHSQRSEPPCSQYTLSQYTPSGPAAWNSSVKIPPT